MTPSDETLAIESLNWKDLLRRLLVKKIEKLHKHGGIVLVITHCNSENGAGVPCLFIVVRCVIVSLVTVNTCERKLVISFTPTY